jgi:hypothetical protein
MMSSIAGAVLGALFREGMALLVESRATNRLDWICGIAILRRRFQWS